MIQYKIGSLMDVKHGLIAHGCNCQGVMGSGVARLIRDQYPWAYKAYKEMVNPTSSDLVLGVAQVVKSPDEPDFFVANLMTQLNYGGDPNKRYVSYDAVDDACLSIYNQVPETTKIHIPQIGAGLGNGRWSIIESIIEYRLANYEVTCWIPKNNDHTRP